MASIYEIDKQIYQLVNEDGEIDDIESFEALQLEKAVKTENIALYIKNTIAEMTAIEEEIKNLKARNAVKSNKLARLENLLTYALDGQKFETARTSVSFRKSEAVQLIDEAMIPITFKKEKVTTSIDKTAIKKAIKAGNDIPGAVLEERLNVQVK